MARVRLPFGLGALILAVLGSGPAGPANAQVPPAADPARLEYDRSAGGASCPEESFFRDTVASHLGGRDPFSADAPNRITLSLRRRGHGLFVADAVFYGEDGERLGSRELAVSDCTSLVDTMGTIVATWLRPILLPEAPKPPPPPEAPKPPPPPEAPKPPPPPEAPKPAPSARPRVIAELGPQMSFATLPATALGLSAAVGVRWPKLSLALDARADLPASSAPKSGGDRVRATLIVGSVVPCLHVRWFAGCGLAAGGALIAEVKGTHYAGRNSVVPFVGAGVRLGIEIPLAPPLLSLRVTGDVLFPVLRIPVQLSRAEDWAPAPAGGALGVRLVASF